MESIDKIKQMEIEAFGEPPLIVPPHLPISKVIGILKEENAYEAFILKENKVGFASIREILKSTNNINSKISSIASFIPKVSSKISVSEAARIMDEYRIRALPIFDGNKLTKAVKASSLFLRQV